MSDRSKQRLRMWIQLLRVARRTENRLREHLRVHHQTTLPRFDVMAALYRRPDGMMMTELSRMLLISNGNATAVVDRLIQEDLVSRDVPAHDRRSVHVSLTEKGRATFRVWAEDHERDLAEEFDDMDDGDVETLIAILKRIGKKDRK